MNTMDLFPYSSNNSLLRELAGIWRSVASPPQPAVIPDALRPRHVRIAGDVGSGKTTLAALMAFQDAVRGRPVIILDPHQTLITRFLGNVLARQNHDSLLRRFVYWPVAGDGGRVHTLPFLDYTTPMTPYAAAQRFLEPCLMAWPYLAEGAPVFAQVGTATLMSLYQGGRASGRHYQITEALSFLQNNAFRAEVLRQAGAAANEARQVFDSSFNQLSVQNQLARRYSFENKIAPFCLNETLRAVVGADTPSIRWPDVDSGSQIVAIDLSGLDDEPRLLLTTAILHGLGRYVFSRQPEVCPPVCLYVDEVSDFLGQRGAAPIFERFASKARKWNLWMTVIQQQVNQGDVPETNRLLWTLATQIIFRQTEYTAALDAVRNLQEYDAEAVRMPPPAEGRYPMMWQVSEEERLAANQLQRLPDRHYCLKVGTHWHPKVQVVPNLDRATVSAPAVTAAMTAGMAGTRAVSDILAEIARRTERPGRTASPPPLEQA